VANEQRYRLPKLIVQLVKIGLASEGMRVEIGVASPEPAVGVFTPAGTCPGRLRRHCVIGCADLDRTRLPQGPAAVGFGGGARAGQRRGRCLGAGLAARVPRLSVGHDRRRGCLANPDTVRRPQDDSCGRAGKVRELQTNSPFCKPICKPDAARHGRRSRRSETGFVLSAEVTAPARDGLRRERPMSYGS